MNKSILKGRLTRDLEVRKTTNGTSVSTFTLAVPRRKNKDKNETITDFPSCVVWGNLADTMRLYLKKGMMIEIVGSIQTRSYEDPNNAGKKVYVTEVVVEEFEFAETKQVQEKEKVDSQETYNIPRDYLPF